MAYLTFLIDNYSSLTPDGAVFIHGARWAWHNDAPDYDNAALLVALNVSAALEPHGYHNLRCDWSASTCAPDEAKPQGSLETKLIALLEPWNARAVSDAALPQTLATLFGGDDEISKGVGRVSLSRGEAVRSQCCAQFIVSRERIWQHKREEYVALRQWLLDDDSGAPQDDRVAGRVLSYVWHILFMPHDEYDIQSAGLDARPGVDLDWLNELACPKC